jgi:hypothetical protein
MHAAFYEPCTDLRTLVDATCALCGRDLSRQTPCDLLMWYPEGHLGPMLLIGLICEGCSAAASESGEVGAAGILDMARTRRRRHLRVVE